MQLSLTRFAVFLAFLTLPLLPRQAAAQSGKYAYLQMTTIELLAPGGTSRSRVLFTPDFKGQKEVVLEDLFGVLGISLKHVRANEEAIIRYLEEANSEGWELVQTTPLTQSAQNNTTTSPSFFMTRYLFRRSNK